MQPFALLSEIATVPKLISGAPNDSFLVKYLFGEANTSLNFLLLEDR